MPVLGAPGTILGAPGGTLRDLTGMSPAVEPPHVRAGVAVASGQRSAVVGNGRAGVAISSGARGASPWPGGASG